MTRTKTTLILWFALAGTILTGCASMRRVNAATFNEYGKRTRGLHSAHDYTLLGVENGRAMIRHWTAIALGGSRTVTYWIPIEELPPEIAGPLRHNMNPW